LQYGTVRSAENHSVRDIAVAAADDDIAIVLLLLFSCFGVFAVVLLVLLVLVCWCWCWSWCELFDPKGDGHHSHEAPVARVS
jgi:hypothetical protein